MSRIETKFLELKKQGRKGLITYITAGDPSLKVTEELVRSFENEGVDFVELGIPFSDPLADGVINQLAAMRALKAGITVKKILSAVERIRRKSDIPIILFTYLNPVLKYGFEKFGKEAYQKGVDGILILDLPPEEADDYKRIMDKNKINTIFLVAPTTTDERIKKITSQANGFIYCVSRTGVTGTRNDISTEVPALVRRIKNVSALPVAVGFGISNAQQVAALSKVSDAVVVGSAIVKRIEENASHPQLVRYVTKFVRELVQTLHKNES